MCMKCPLSRPPNTARGTGISRSCPVPGKLVPYPPEEPAKEDKAPETPAKEELDDEGPAQGPENPLTKEGQPETVTTMKVANIRPFEGHPFAVRDQQGYVGPGGQHQEIRRAGAGHGHPP